MAITLKGIRLKSITAKPDPESNEQVLSCSYQLMSSTDKVLAEQTIGEYGGGIKVQPSPQTIKAMEEFLTLYRNDIQTVLGLDIQ